MAVNAFEQEPIAKSVSAVMTVTFGQDNLPIFDDCHSDAWNFPLFHDLIDERIEAS